MCESNVFLSEDGNLTEIMQDVAKLEVRENIVVCLGVLGERMEIEDAKIIEANLMEHRIVLGRVK